MIGREGAAGRRAVWLGATAVSALLAGGAASAEAPQSPAPGGEPVTSTVVVTGRSSVVATEAAAATKTDTPIIETPQSISVVDQADITLHNFQDLAQAIGYSAGVTPRAFGLDPHFSQFNIRGFNQSYTSVYRDGLRVYGVNQIAPLIEPYGLSSLEIVRGPTSVLYGQNAPGGLIDAISKRPQPTAGGELQLQVGNYDRYDGRFDLNAPLAADGSAAARLVGLVRESGTQFGNVPDDETYLAPSLTWKPRDGTALTLLGTYQRDSNNSPYEFYEKRLLPPGFPQTVYKGAGDQPYERQIQENYDVGYIFSQALGSGWTLNQDFRYAHAHSVYAYPSVTGLGQSGGAVVINRVAYLYKQELDSVALDTDVTGHVRTGPLEHTLLFGVDYQHLPQQAHLLVGPAPPVNYFNPVYLPIPGPTTLAMDTRQGIDQVGVYGQDQIKLGSHWTLTGSVRNDWSFSSSRNLLGALAATTPASQDDSAVTGRVGLVYLSDIGLAPYVSYSTSFLPQPGLTFAGQPFDPLTGEQYEVGVRYQPKGGWLLATVSLYDLTESNVLGPDPVLSHRGFQVETGEERSRGAEFELTAHPVPELNLTAAYTYDDVRVTRSTVAAQVGRQAQNVPANQGSVFADYTFAHTVLRGFGLGAGVRYAGRSYDGNDNVFANKSQTYVDAVVHYDFGRWRAAINATNIGDRVIPVCFSGVCNVSQARQVIGSMTLRY